MDNIEKLIEIRNSCIQNRDRLLNQINNEKLASDLKEVTTREENNTKKDKKSKNKSWFKRLGSKLKKSDSRMLPKPKKIGHQILSGLKKIGSNLLSSLKAVVTSRIFKGCAILVSLFTVIGIISSFAGASMLASVGLSVSGPVLGYAGSAIAILGIGACLGTVGLSVYKFFSGIGIKTKEKLDSKKFKKLLGKGKESSREEKTFEKDKSEEQVKTDDKKEEILETKTVDDEKVDKENTEIEELKNPVITEEHKNKLSDIAKEYDEIAKIVTDVINLISGKTEELEEPEIKLEEPKEEEVVFVGLDDIENSIEEEKGMPRVKRNNKIAA